LLCMSLIFTIAELYCIMWMLWLEIYEYHITKTWKQHSPCTIHAKMAWFGAIITGKEIHQLWEPVTHSGSQITLARPIEKDWYVCTTQFLASHILTFRGHTKILSLDVTQNSGNVTDLMKVIPKYALYCRNISVA
jgi:hypothetical protein